MARAWCRQTMYRSTAGSAAAEAGMTWSGCGRRSGERGPDCSKCRSMVRMSLKEFVVMSLVEMLPDIQSLPRADKLKLIQLLAQELAETEEPPPLQAGLSYPVWSPDQAFAAAETLLQTLRTE